MVAASGDGGKGGVNGVLAWHLSGTHDKQDAACEAVAVRRPQRAWCIVLSKVVASCHASPLMCQSSILANLRRLPPT